MGRAYGDYAENAAQKVLQMWMDTFETGPSRPEMLQDSQEAAIRSTPVRIETLFMAFKILFRSNQEDTEFVEYLGKGIFHIPIRYGLNEAETLQLCKEWDDVVAERI